MAYVLAILYMVLIGLIFRCLDVFVRISGSLGWTIAFFVVGFLISLFPAYRGDRSLKCFMGCIVLFACFSAGMATLCDAGRGSLHARLWRLYQEIEPGMTIAGLDRLLAQEVPEIREMVSLKDSDCIMIGKQDVVVSVKNGIVTTKTFIDD
jgi:hypothetical protein